jgi:cysteine desulfurase
MIYYFDNCATTRVDDEVVALLNKFHTENYFNPSALNKFSAAVAREISASRELIATTLGATPQEIFFTSGGTEADNTAIFGALRAKGGNIVLCASEHSAAYNCVMQLKSRGFEVRIAETTDTGAIDASHFVSLVDGNTLLAIMMHANNETGAINDVKALNSAVKAKNPATVTFSDGIQAVTKIPVNLHDLGVDMYSYAGHKIHCSKGIGCLYVKNGVYCSPLLYGSGQEKGFRSGTEYVGAAVALGYSTQKGVELLSANIEKYRHFKQMIYNTLTEIGNCRVVCTDNCVDCVMSVVVGGTKSEVLVHMLEENGIVVGTSSACSSKNKQSRVLTAAKLTPSEAGAVIRISFSKYTTAEEVAYLCAKLSEAATTLRKIMR